MSNRDAILKAVAGLPDSMNWAALTAAVYRVVARDGTPDDVARFQAAIVGPEAMAEFENPPTDGIPIQNLLAELEAHSG